MKKSLLLLPLLFLLVSCTPKKKTCTLVATKQIDYPTAMKRLGLEPDPSGKLDGGTLVKDFCEAVWGAP